MIQRIQSLYLLISMILLGIVTFGTPLFYYNKGVQFFKIDAYGLSEFNQAEKIIAFKSYPLYFSFIALIILCFLTLMAYKKINQQLRLMRMTFFVYLIAVIGLSVFSMMDDQWLFSGDSTSSKAIGYYIFVSGLPFCYLAQIGIKRDKNLLDSLNRLR